MSGSCAAIASFNPFLSHPDGLFMLPVQSFGSLIGRSIFTALLSFLVLLCNILEFVYILSFPWQIQFEQNQP